MSVGRGESDVELTTVEERGRRGGERSGRKRVERVAASAAGAFNLFDDMLLEKSKATLSRENPVERLLGLQATWLFVVLLVVSMAVLFLYNVLRSVRTPIVYNDPNFSTWSNELKDKGANCECRNLGFPLAEIATMEMEWDVLCGEHINNVTSLCAKNIGCTSTGVLPSLLAMRALCKQAKSVATAVSSQFLAQPVVTPSLLTESALHKYLASLESTAFQLITSTYVLPLGIVDTVQQTDGLLSVQALYGYRARRTPLFTNTMGALITPTTNDRKFFGFDLQTCDKHDNYYTCGLKPYCRWDDAGGCKSLFCPTDASKDVCLEALGCWYDDDRDICVTRGCDFRTSEKSCNSQQGVPNASFADPGLPSPCKAVRRTFQGEKSIPYCKAQELQCSDFTTKRACVHAAPEVVCHWDDSRQQCSYIADLTCTDTTSPCFPRNATSISFDEHIPKYLATSWAGTNKTDPLLAKLQPDVIVLQQSRLLGLANDDPLFRQAIGTPESPCSCFDDYSCTTPRVIVIPGDPRVYTFNASCSRFHTIGTFETAVWNSDAFPLEFHMPAPLAHPSKWKYVQDGFHDAFLDSFHINSSFHSYFSSCKPSTCTYYESRGQSPADAITTLISLLGGLSVALQVLSKQIVLFFCKRRVESLVASRPDLYYPKGHPLRDGLGASSDEANKSTNPLSKFDAVLAAAGAIDQDEDEEGGGGEKGEEEDTAPRWRKR